MAELAFVKIKGSAALINRLNKTGENLTPVLRDAVYQGLLDCQAYMKNNFLTGQRLRVRTGKLRSNWGIALDLPTSGDAVSGILITNTSYAPVQEYGYTGPQHVKEHPRRLLNRSGPKKWREANPRKFNYITQAGRTKRSFRKNEAGETVSVMVRAHDRDVKITPKWFLRDTAVMNGEHALGIVRKMFGRLIERGR